jgi:hypothetical protein
VQSDRAEFKQEKLQVSQETLKLLATDFRTHKALEKQSATKSPKFVMNFNDGFNRQIDDKVF